MRWYHSFTGVARETGERRVFFVEYFMINPSLGRDVPVLSQRSGKRRRPSYVMVRAGAFGADGAPGVQLHAFYPVAALKVAAEPMVLQVEEHLYRETHISGCLDIGYQEASQPSYLCEEGYMDWDLEVHKSVSCHTGPISNPFFCALGALDSFWHGEGIRTQYQGTVTLNGIPYEVIPEECYGYADKHWGRSFNRPWLQLASCHLVSSLTGREGKHTALAVNGCSPRFLCFPLKRKLMIQLTWAGEDFEFHFARFRYPSRTKWNVKESRKRLVWQIVGQSRDAVIKITGACLKEDMLTMNYDAPDGSRPKAPVWFGGTGSGTVQIFRKTPGGKELLDTLSAEDIFCVYNAY